jgi:hypothetical protein
MTIPTVQSIHRARRFQDRRRAAAARVLAQMQRGASLNLTYTKHGSDFVLSNGMRVSPAVALMVVNNTSVVSVNDGLWPQTPQTWRYVETCQLKRR